jgi:hypothetical protein
MFLDGSEEKTVVLDPTYHTNTDPLQDNSCIATYLLDEHKGLINYTSVEPYYILTNESGTSRTTYNVGSGRTLQNFILELDLSIESNKTGIMLNWGARGESIYSNIFQVSIVKVNGYSKFHVFSETGRGVNHTYLFDELDIPTDGEYFNFRLERNGTELTFIINDTQSQTINNFQWDSTKTTLHVLGTYSTYYSYPFNYKNLNIVSYRNVGGIFNTIEDLNGNFHGRTINELDFDEDAKIVKSANLTEQIFTDWYFDDPTFSFTCHIKKRPDSPTEDVIAEFETANGSISFTVEKINNNTVRFNVCFYKGTKWYCDIEIDTMTFSYDWHSVALSISSFNDIGNKIFFDKREYNLIDSGEYYNNVSISNIGGNLKREQIFDGLIDHIRVFNKAIDLNEAEFLADEYDGMRFYILRIGDYIFDDTDKDILEAYPQYFGISDETVTINNSTSFDNMPIEGGNPFSKQKKKRTLAGTISSDDNTHNKTTDFINEPGIVPNKTNKKSQLQNISGSNDNKIEIYPDTDVVRADIIANNYLNNNYDKGQSELSNDPRISIDIFNKDGRILTNLDDENRNNTNGVIPDSSISYEEKDKNTYNYGQIDVYDVDGNIISDVDAVVQGGNFSNRIISTNNLTDLGIDFDTQLFNAKSIDDSYTKTLHGLETGELSEFARTSETKLTVWSVNGSKSNVKMSNIYLSDELSQIDTELVLTSNIVFNNGIQFNRTSTPWYESKGVEYHKSDSIERIDDFYETKGYIDVLTIDNSVESVFYDDNLVDGRYLLAPSLQKLKKIIRHKTILTLVSTGIRIMDGQDRWKFHNDYPVMPLFDEIGQDILGEDAITDGMFPYSRDLRKYVVDASNTRVYIDWEDENKIYNNYSDDGYTKINSLSNFSALMESIYLTDGTGEIDFIYQIEGAQLLEAKLHKHEFGIDHTVIELDRIFEYSNYQSSADFEGIDLHTLERRNYGDEFDTVYKKPRNIVDEILARRYNSTETVNVERTMNNYDGDVITIDFNYIVTNHLLHRYKGFRRWEVSFNNVYKKESKHKTIASVINHEKRRIIIEDYAVDMNSYEVPLVNVTTVGMDSYKWLDPLSNPITSRLHTRIIDNQFDLEIVTAERQKVDLVDGIIDVYGDLINLSIINSAMSLDKRLYVWDKDHRSMPIQVTEWSAIYHKARSEYYTSDARIAIPELYETKLLTVSQVDSLDDQWYFRDIDSEASDYVQLWEWLVTQPQIIIERNGLYDPKQRLIDVIHSMNMGIDTGRLKFLTGFRDEPTEVDSRMSADFREKTRHIENGYFFDVIKLMRRLDPNAYDSVFPVESHGWTQRHMESLDIKVIALRLKDLVTQAKEVELQDGVYIHNDSFEINVDTLRLHRFNIDVDFGPKVEDKLYVPVKGIEERKPIELELRLYGIDVGLDKLYVPAESFVDALPMIYKMRHYGYTFSGVYTAPEVEYAGATLTLFEDVKGLDITDKLFIARETFIGINGTAINFSYYNPFSSIVDDYMSKPIKYVESKNHIDNIKLYYTNMAPPEDVDSETKFYNNGLISDRLKIVNTDFMNTFIKPDINDTKYDIYVHDSLNLDSALSDSGILTDNDTVGVQYIWEPHALSDVSIDFTNSIFNLKKSWERTNVWSKPFHWILTDKFDEVYERFDLKSEKPLSKLWSSVSSYSSFVNGELRLGDGDYDNSKIWSHIQSYAQSKEGNSEPVDVRHSHSFFSTVYDSSEAFPVNVPDTKLGLVGPIIIVRRDDPQYFDDKESEEYAKRLSATIYGPAKINEIDPNYGRVDLGGIIANWKAQFDRHGVALEPKLVPYDYIYDNAAIPVDPSRCSFNLKGSPIRLVAMYSDNGALSGEFKEVMTDTIWGMSMAVEVDLNFAPVDEIVALLQKEDGTPMASVYGEAMAVEIDVDSLRYNTEKYSLQDEWGKYRDSIFEANQLRKDYSDKDITHQDIFAQTSTDSHPYNNSMYDFSLETGVGSYYDLSLDFPKVRFDMVNGVAVKRTFIVNRLYDYIMIKDLDINSVDSMTFDFKLKIPMFDDHILRDLNKSTINNVRVLNSSVFRLNPFNTALDIKSDMGVDFHTSLVSEYTSLLSDVKYFKFIRPDYDLMINSISDTDFDGKIFGLQLRDNLFSEALNNITIMDVDISNVRLYADTFTSSLSTMLRRYDVNVARGNVYSDFGKFLVYNVPKDYKWDYNIRDYSNAPGGYNLYESKYGSSGSETLIHDIRLNTAKSIMSTYLLNVSTTLIADMNVRVMKDTIGYEKSTSYEASFAYEWDFKRALTFNPLVAFNRYATRTESPVFDHKHQLLGPVYNSIESYDAYNENDKYDYIKAALTKTPYSKGNKFTEFKGINLEPVWSQSGVDYNIMHTRDNGSIFNTPPIYAQPDIIPEDSFNLLTPMPLYQVKKCKQHLPSYKDIKVARKEPGVYVTELYKRQFESHDWMRYEKHQQYMNELELGYDVCNACNDMAGTLYSPNKIEVKQDIYFENNHNQASFRMRGPYRWEGWYQDVKVYVADNEPTSMAWDRRYSTDSLLQGNTYHTEKEDRIILTPLTGTDIYAQIDYWITNGPYANRYQVSNWYDDYTTKTEVMYSIETTKTVTSENSDVTLEVDVTPYETPNTHKFSRYGKELYNYNIDKKYLEDIIEKNKKTFDDSEAYTYTQEIKAHTLKVEGEIFQLAAPINMHIKGPIQPKKDVPVWAFTSRLPDDWWEERYVMVFEKDNDRTSLFSNKFYLQ